MNKVLIMTELDRVIAAAFASEGKQEDVNKVYLTLLRALLVVPVRKGPILDNTEEPFVPLFAKIDEKYFLMAFDTLERLRNWASDRVEDMGYVELLGRDFIAGMSDKIYFCLNLGTDYYKEFSPDEVKRLKMVINRLNQL
ncbi:MAG: hypothetical protein K0S27_695 [Gammaproteobacteria bacterium]|jgi:hypothetical protein|nr:hypothetical protein [Gammaproteobacteria bacterium]